MQLVEKHVINRNHPYFAEIDAACFASKNLYNAANYELRQLFFGKRKLCSYPALDKLMQRHEAYRLLPTKVSQWVLKTLRKAWSGYFAAMREYRNDPSKFLGEPRIPGYKDKDSGRNLLVYSIQAISSKLLKIGQIKPSGLGCIIKTAVKDVDQVRIIPRKSHYVVEVVYTVQESQADLDYTLAAGIDMGIDNLAAITSNKPGFTPLLVNGRPLKSINQFYNKRKAELQSILGSDKAKSHRLTRVTDRRNRRIDHYLHTASRQIVDILVSNRIGVLVVGRNQGWKQSVNIGKRNNQNFVQIPHARFFGMLKYKCELFGIKVLEQEESYTSKCSFLDLEPIQKHESYVGRRVQRGMFKSSNGTRINADVNGSYNIIRKALPAAFAQGIEGVVVRPLPLPVA